MNRYLYFVGRILDLLAGHLAILLAFVVIPAFLVYLLYLLWLAFPTLAVFLGLLITFSFIVNRNR